MGKRSYDLSPFLTNSEPKSVPTPSTSVFIATLLILAAVVISSGGRGGGEEEIHCTQLSLHESSRACVHEANFFLACSLPFFIGLAFINFHFP